MKIPRLRVFAGPNGSGKSTMKSAIPHHLIGIYINPDEIEKTANESGLLSFSDFQLEVEPSEVQNRVACNNGAVRLSERAGRIHGRPGILRTHHAG